MGIGGHRDSAWFRSHIPIGFSNANWSGAWQTRYYFGMSGRLLVRLPDPLPENEDFKAEALVYYPVYSVWKTGQFVKMDFRGRFSTESPNTSGRSQNRIPGRKPGGKLEFKGIAGKQVVEYVAVMNESQLYIAGGYTSQHPADYGVFSIRYY